jgi:hypothetical protein
MSYHETFWVVVGTAAPVIALAAVVALPDASATGPLAVDHVRAAVIAGTLPETLGEDEARSFLARQRLSRR